MFIHTGEIKMFQKIYTTAAGKVSLTVTEQTDPDTVHIDIYNYTTNTIDWFRLKSYNFIYYQQ